jgi:regulator of sigma E protease
MTDVKDEKGDWLPIGVGIDPLRLPDWFAERAGQKVQVRVKRDVKEGNPVSEEVELVPDDRQGWIERPAAGDCPLSVPAIGVAFHVLHHVVAVDENGPAAKAGIRKDDNLVSIQFIPEEGAPKTEGKETVTFEDKSRNWAHAFWLLQSYPLRKVMIEFKSLGDDKPKTVEVLPEVAADWYLPMRGFTMKQLLKTRRADNIGEAISMGFGTARDELVNMWMTIRGLTSRRISTKALGGPIRIFGTALHFTRLGLPDLMLFLGILSVSLAVLNFLPIPVLDGGHFMFLCWEGIRGKPPSDWVVVTATYIGFALVLTLMAWVMYMDIAGMMSRAG